MCRSNMEAGDAPVQRCWLTNPRVLPFNLVGRGWLDYAAEEFAIRQVPCKT